MNTQVLRYAGSAYSMPLMTPEQYRKAVSKLGFSQEGIAPYLGIGKRTSQGYALGETAVPKTVAILLRLMITGKITAKDIETAHDRETKGR